ncbi:hypothetical protein GOEFS_017_00360 [Gordonia effusa NBRC 100432]|uniref:DUF1304 domain-containing protein n=1 Tax=Gordonia effusa NBRC 100432 TaxID=1077974 RepID=H0QVR9_9ACTN|nr:DUF1304 domain-containing protein [Gordonia effusa]GAB16920.1 hypothetical protein GOEFS_017_00360 [Gordonia effusa NBRC 100432]
MLIAGLVFAGLAALIHVYIFYMESIAWTSRSVRAVFGTTEEEANATKPLAFNQGFYNLFLAILIAVGIVVIACGTKDVGSALVFAGAGSMVAAGLVLLLSDPSKASAALKQLVPPAIGCVLLAIALV